MPIEIHEVEITTSAASGRPTQAGAPAASVTPAPAAAVQQSPQGRLLSARLTERELAARASRLRAD